MGASLRTEGATQTRPKYEFNKKKVFLLFNFKDWNCKYTCKK